MSETQVGSPTPTPPEPGGAVSQRRMWIRVLGPVVAALTVAVFLMPDGEDESPAARDADRMGDVRGIGVDPRDGAVYVGTENGVFRLAKGEPAAEVGNLAEDVSGFVVAGPGRFLASGHVGEGSRRSTVAGLLESTDAGQTWHAMSLAGQADLHSLQVRGERVYGLDAVSGSLMTSPDGITWEIRGREPMIDVAVSTSDPDVLVATSGSGLKRSDDGGRTFEQVGEAPPIQFVAWAPEGLLLGVTPSGSLYASEDGGKGWERRGSLGARPDALAATSKDAVYAAVQGAVLASDDGGRTFETRYSDDGK